MSTNGGCIMKTDELYRSIENPMDQSDIIDDILCAYLEDGSFYGNIVQCNYQKDKDRKATSHFYSQSKNEFYIYLFQEWKSGLQYVATHDFYGKKYRSMASLLYKYLKDMKPNTYEEVLYILNGEDTNREDIKNALEFYRWDKNGFYSGWEPIDSREVYAKTHKNDQVEHRLYLNCDSYLVHFISLEFMRRCKEHKVRFRFKFDECSDRDETLVVYSNTKNLALYVEILEEITEIYDFYPKICNHFRMRRVFYIDSGILCTVITHGEKKGNCGSKKYKERLVTVWTAME